ncbi:RIP metalloprotease RseP [Lysobacter gummosus]|uniref:Zinc metalloprotease n=1 Tax=Lysobacter gummosus TaxID=262324 RepID=A0ABY3X5P3_9GAMM|nr:RIP metalloprotease RseP [Lysobacter gummosus]ALN92280.1 RIP metalloprotease RseP [Lysobacter gummosus]UNP27886.1 RIP metalloprotease RseP [Lysobacter gummosus]
MSEILGSLWWLIISIGVLVTFHEFGHFWVARRCGVKVLRFSVGFGKPLYERTGKDGTVYAIGMIPLGGYVKMLDEREYEITEALAPQAFNRKPVWQRIAIVAAGPVANLILCVAFLWGMFVIGRPDFAPVVGSASGIAAESGLRRGDTLMQIGDRPTPTWSEVQMALIPYALDREDVRVKVRTDNGTEVNRELQLSRLPAAFDERRAVQVIGLGARHELVPAVIGRINPDTAAWGVLAEGDRITALDGEPIPSWNDLPPAVARLGERGGKAMIEVVRNGDRLALEIAPKRMQRETGEKFWGLGVLPATPQPPRRDAVLRYGPIQALPAALGESAHQARELFAMIGRAFTGRVSLQNTVAGPVTIGRAANAYANNGPAWYLQLLAMLSLSLGILNLLPIPILDGGHLLYYLIELVKGSPVSERVMAAGHFVGLALIASLMGLAFYNDILNNLVR